MEPQTKQMRIKTNRTSFLLGFHRLLMITHLNYSMYQLTWQCTHLVLRSCNPKLPPGSITVPKMFLLDSYSVFFVFIAKTFTVR